MLTPIHTAATKTRNFDQESGRACTEEKSLFALWRQSAEEIGNKAANLGFLRGVTQDISCLKVPTFHPVSHKTVSEFLEKQTKGKFKAKWKAFCQSMRKERGLTQTSRRLLEEIEALVVDTFCQSGSQIPDIEEFLSKIPPDCRTIIRSTGREDTIKLANAGGNKTCINIPPKKDAIALAMGKVVASYFSARSIGQRLQAGDHVTQEPFVPVLLQVMVGEPKDGEIPASGVIFADESTGRTPGVSCIEAAWGHNELVVGGLGPVDRYFVGLNGRIHQVVVYKKDRLVSRQNGKGLVRKKNLSDIRSEPALKPCTLYQLHEFYQQLKPLYGGHIDSEFTKLDPLKEFVHLLQVRPLPQGEKLEPTHLNSKVHPLAKARPMVPSDCRVRILQRSDEVHCGRTVGDARQTFLALPPDDQARVKAILVSTPGGSNSHEATEFRANNLPVLCLPNAEKKLVEASLKDKDTLLLIDVVEGQIASIDALQKKSDEEALIEKGVIVPGWAKHPLPAIQSITGEGLGDRELSTFLAELVEAGPAESTHALFSLVEGVKFVPEEILKSACSTHLDQRLLATVMILKVGFSLCSKFSKTPLEKRALAVARQLIRDAKDVWDAHKDKSGALQIQKLYQLNWLSAALTQLPQPGVIDADSPFTLLALHHEMCAAKQILQRKYQVTDNWRIEMLSALLRAANFGLNPKIQKDWGLFCQALCARGSKDQINRLAVVLHRIASVNVIPYWLHAVFVPVWSESKTTRLSLNNLIAETSRSTQALDRSGSLQEVAAHFEKLKSSIATPQTFDKFWEKVQRDQQVLDGIVELYLKQNAFGRLLLSNAVGKFVESFDGMIKEMLARPENKEQKVQRLKAMLGPYLGIMHRLLKLVDSKDVPGHENVQEVSEHIGNIADRLFKTANTADHLNISPRFNVSAAQMGSGANFRRHQPQTLADLFTLTHQNLLFALAYLQKKEDVFVEHLPAEVLKVADALASTNMLNFQVDEGKQCFISRPPSLISVALDFPNVTMRYNAPQRNHSALFEISATLNPRNGEVQELTVGGKLFGYQAHDMPRMPWAAAYAELCTRAGGFAFAKGGAPVYNRPHDMVEFTWKVDASQVKTFSQHLPDYLLLITSSLYSGSRSRRIPIPGGEKNFRFTDNWGMPKLAHDDNSTTLKEYYSQDDVSTADSSWHRFKEAVENIKRIHPEWDSGKLCPADLEPIAEWHKFVGQPWL